MAGQRVTSDVGPYAIVPLWVTTADITAGAVRLYAFLLARYADRDGMCWPARKRLADDLHAVPKSIDRWVQELERIGALEKRHRTDQNGDLTSNEYHLHLVPDVDISVQGSGQESRHPRDTNVPTGGDTNVTENQTHSEPDPSEPDPSLRDGGSEVRNGDSKEPDPEPDAFGAAFVAELVALPIDGGEAVARVVLARLRNHRAGRVPMTDDAIKRLVAEYTPQLHGRTTVLRHLSDGAQHKSYKRWDNTGTYIRGWLRREVERMAGRRGGRREPEATESIRGRRFERAG